MGADKSTSLPHTSLDTMTPDAILDYYDRMVWNIPACASRPRRSCSTASLRRVRAAALCRAGKDGAVMAWLALAAVPVVLFTFIGVNTLLPRLHSYG